jgi:hypothetical protein
MKQLVKLFGLAVLLGASMNAQAGLWGNVKEDAAKAWDGTKENASKVADDGEEAYDEGKDTSLKEIKEEIKEQGVMPVKPKEDEAGIPVD